MRRFLCCFLPLLAASALPAQAGTYRWIDPKTGQTVISDTPPPGNVRQSRKEDGGSSEKPLPPALRKAVDNFPVTLYVSADCGQPCQNARALLIQRGIPFTEKHLKENADFAELRALIGDAFVPTLKVGKQTIKGFQAGNYHDQLDWAGYPGSPAR